MPVVARVIPPLARADRRRDAVGHGRGAVALGGGGAAIVLRRVALGSPQGGLVGGFHLALGVLVHGPGVGADVDGRGRGGGHADRVAVLGAA